MQVPARKGVRPSGRKNHHKTTGFTIVELMVSVALLGTILALALPSYREMVEKRQLTQGAEQVHAFLNSIQGFASRSNENVTVSYSMTDSDDWCFGATLGDTACDCTETSSAESDFCSIDGAAARVTNDQTGNRGLLQSITGDGAYAFDPIRGLFVNLDDSLDMEMHSPSGDYQLRLIVSNTGHTTLCSKDTDHSVPGYKICPADEVEEEVVEEEL